MPAWWDRLLGSPEAKLVHLERKHRELVQRRDVQRSGALVAAAADISAAREHLMPGVEAWQRDVWRYYDTLGEFRYAVTWFADMCSRIRLRAAEIQPGRDEPSLVDTGVASDLVSEFAGGPGGQSQVMSTLATYFAVPGEGYIIGEELNTGNRWQVRSSDEVRQRGETFEVVDERALTRVKWRTLGDDSLVIRAWRPHKRWYHVADSPARAALPIMHELELVNRHISAQYISRLASAGLLIIPDEVSFPVREEFQDEADPFVAEWIAVAKEAIATPGTAAAVIPIPLRVPGEYVDKIKHIDFTLKIDEKIIEKRESAIKRLATELDLPAEVLTGMGDVNHWSAWQIDENAVKAHIAPDIELMCYSLTEGYLKPRLLAAGEDPDRWVVWYDASELTIRPDRSDNALQVYDRGELSGEALRRETGFDEDDRPTDEELKDQILKWMAHQAATATAALDELTGTSLAEVVQAPVVSGAPEGPPEIESPADGPPDTRDNPPPPPGETSAIAARVHQAQLMHALRFTSVGWEVMHPAECQEHLFSCPVTWATRRFPHHAVPGRSGVYECWLNANGDAVIGAPVPQLDGRTMLSGGRGGVSSKLPGRRGGVTSRNGHGAG